METSQPRPRLDESARTTGRTSAHSARVEIITRGEPRRSWTLAQKQEIVAESFGPELTPTEVARKHAISSGQLYTWRQQLLGVRPALVRRPVQQFAQVDLEAGPVSAAGRPPAPGDIAAIDLSIIGAAGRFDRGRAPLRHDGAHGRPC